MKLLLEAWQNFLNEQEEQQKQKFIICLGDSQTEDRKSYAWKIPRKNKYVKAIHSKTTGWMLKKLRSAPSGIIEKATHAVIWGGTNDIANSLHKNAPSNYTTRAQKNMESMIKELQSKNPKIQICLITLPEYTYIPYGRYNNRNKSPAKDKIQENLNIYNQFLKSKQSQTIKVIEINELQPLADVDAWGKSTNVCKQKWCGGKAPDRKRLHDGLHPGRQLQTNLTAEIFRWAGLKL